MKLKYYFFKDQDKLTKDMNGKSFNLRIIAQDEKYGHIDDDGTYDINEIERIIAEVKPETLQIKGFIQSDFEFLTSLIKECVTSLEIFQCPKINDFSTLQGLDKLLHINIYWNNKATKLWEVGKNLKKLHITDCNKIVDFTGLNNSKLKSLQLYGCDGLSSMKSKLVIKDLNIIFDLKTVESLGLDIVKNYDDEYFLNGISKMSNLKQLFIPENYFTFEQFAWLKS